MNDETIFGIVVIIFLIIVSAIIIGGTMAIVPRYNLWSKELSGQADLKEAEWSKKIIIEEARAEADSAVLRASAEVERAKGVAEANKIIGDSLKNNEGYLRYLWIIGLQDGNSEVIYVPTEANLPILEAGKRS